MQSDRKPPGRPRSGNMYASTTLSLDLEMWAKIDAMAEEFSVTRHKMLRALVEKAITDTEIRK